MAEPIHCEAGDWVEVRYVLLEPADRAANLPADTAAQPLLVWVKGFARTPAELGAELTIETVTGRIATGALTDVNPGYDHTFGRPTPELTHVGRDLRASLATYRAAAAAVPVSAASPKAGE